MIQHRQGISWSDEDGNGSQPWPGGGVPTFVSVACDRATFAAGQAFRVRAYHDRGSNLTVTWKFFVQYLGPPPP